MDEDPTPPVAADLTERTSVAAPERRGVRRMVYDYWRARSAAASSGASTTSSSAAARRRGARRPAPARRRTPRRWRRASRGARCPALEPAGGAGASEGKVVLYREYHKHEMPNITISRADVFRPLLQLALRDGAVASALLAARARAPPRRGDLPGDGGVAGRRLASLDGDAVAAAAAAAGAYETGARLERRASWPAAGPASAAPSAPATPGARASCASTPTRRAAALARTVAGAAGAPAFAEERRGAYADAFKLFDALAQAEAPDAAPSAPLAGARALALEWDAVPTRARARRQALRAAARRRRRGAGAARRSSRQRAALGAARGRGAVGVAARCARAAAPRRWTRATRASATTSRLSTPAPSAAPRAARGARGARRRRRRGEARRPRRRGPLGRNAPAGGRFEVEDLVWDLRCRQICR
ncbi:phosphatidylinositol kinase [Aureococcus anophagefferens]|nr:phosphatidylinositol kinase [Aureococcus anophagefferens]